MKNLLRKFIFCGLDIDPLSKKYIQYLLHNTFVLIMALFIIIFYIIGENPERDIIYFSILGVIALNYAFLYYTKWITVTVYFGTFALIFFVSYLVTMFPDTEGQLPWIIVVPFFIFVFHEKKAGIFFGVLNVIVVSIALYDKYSLLPLHEQWHSIIRPLSALIVSSVFIYIFESYRTLYLVKIHELFEIEKEQNKKLQILSTTDSLTGLYNREKIDNILKTLIEKSNTNKSTFSILMLDIDYFKSINDTYGHLAGDTIIKEFSQILKKNADLNVLVGRWGGEEFVLILPESTLEVGIIEAKRLNSIISTHPFSHGLKMSATIGVANFHENDTIDSIVNRADKALYIGKEQGRNRVVDERVLA